MSARIRHLFANSLALCAALMLIGGHWAALQLVAWTGMLWTYSSTGSLVTAVEKTFDGQHPCDLCKTISKGRSEEERAPAQALVQVAKIDAVLAVEFVISEPGFATVFWLPVEGSGVLRLESPPVPPPRLS
jgi:hypothetical protein